MNTLTYIDAAELGGFDFIGDVHGSASRLEVTLASMGYARVAGCWRHPSRVAVFVGDLINRGREQLEAINIVYRMQQEGAAVVLMGNHELYAVLWATPDEGSPGHYLRSRDGVLGRRHRAQHRVFLDSVGEDSALHKQMVQWFSTLPLWVRLTMADGSSARAAHACWDARSVSVLSGSAASKDYGSLGHRYISDAFHQSGVERESIETLLCGTEVKLPPGVFYRDGGGNKRSVVRTKWWGSFDSDLWSCSAVGERLIQQAPNIDLGVLPEVDFDDGTPLFVGHYGLDSPKSPIHPRVVCVDYHDRYPFGITAYRWSGSSNLTSSGFHSSRGLADIDFCGARPECEAQAVA